MFKAVRGTPKATTIERSLKTEEARLIAIFTHRSACQERYEEIDSNYPLVYSIIGSIVLSAYWPPLFFICAIPFFFWYKIWKGDKTEVQREISDCREKIEMIRRRMGEIEFETLVKKIVNPDNK